MAAFVRNKLMMMMMIGCSLAPVGGATCQLADHM